MTILYTITTVFFFIWVFRNTLFLVSLWQLKEYRLDRVVTHIKETVQGRKLILSPTLFLKLLGIVFFGYVIFNPLFLQLFQAYVAILFTGEAMNVFQELSNRKIKRPVPTVKSLVIVFGVLFIVYILFLFPVFEWFFWLLLLDRIIPFLIAFAVLLFSIPTEIYSDLQTQRARKYIEEMRLANKDLLVIGITGSYGKSSTKEYIGQILSKKFRVVKTAGTNNTLIGVVNTVLHHVKKSTEIIVIEMGAYKKGEIAQICAVVKPNIGVLTAISDQHLSLFGSVENIKKAKYELIESLPKNGLALFNGNNESVYEMYKMTKKSKVLYQSFNKTKDLLTVLRMAKGYADSSIVAFNVHADESSVSFHVFLNGHDLHIVAPVLGVHTVENLLPAIYLANSLGMTDKEIKKAIALLTPLQKTMTRYEREKGATLIDDTFNANPDAIMAALSYMKIYKGKKIFVLTPLIELGKNAVSEHDRIAYEIVSVCDVVFLTNKNYFSSFEKALKKTKKSCKISIAEPEKIAAYIKRSTKSGDVALFEGKESGNSLGILI